MNKPITDQAMREWTARAWEEALAKETSMNRDDIIRMARECRVHSDEDWRYRMTDSIDALERFAALVAEHEREACAALENEPGIYSQHDMAEAIRLRGKA